MYWFLRFGKGKEKVSHVTVSGVWWGGGERCHMYALLCIVSSGFCNDSALTGFCNTSVRAVSIQPEVGAGPGAWLKVCDPRRGLEKDSWYTDILFCKALWGASARARQ